MDDWNPQSFITSKRKDEGAAQTFLLFSLDKSFLRVQYVPINVCVDIFGRKKKKKKKK